MFHLPLGCCYHLSGFLFAPNTKAFSYLSDPFPAASCPHQPGQEQGNTGQDYPHQQGNHTARASARPSALAASPSTRQKEIPSSADSLMPLPSFGLRP